MVTKISASLQLEKIWILTKFEGCSSKIGPTTPFWSFLHFWREIQILSTYDLDFLHKAGFYRGWKLVKTLKLFLYLFGDELKGQNLQFWISQKWLEISTPNFYQLSTSMKIRFLQKIKVIGAQNLDFPPKM